MKAQVLRAEIAESYANMHAEHIRNAKANLLDRPSVAVKLMNIVGGRPGWHSHLLNRNI